MEHTVQELNFLHQCLIDDTLPERERALRKDLRSKLDVLVANDVQE